MARLLYIQSSPISEISYSIKAADAFADEYKNKNPGDEVMKMNLFEADLPAFDGLAVEAKYKILHGKEHTEKQTKIWDDIKKTIEQFKSADKYVLAVPMWNFSIPWRLKQYIDILVQPGLTFSYSNEKGYQGLVKGKPLLAVYARGGQYPPDSDFAAYDLQTKYIELIFRFIGFENIQSIIIEPTLSGPDTAETKLRQAIKKAQQLAANF